MKLEHIAIWTTRLEELKEYYTTYFQGVAGNKYHNTGKGFQSYFLRFEGGARLEIMTMASIRPRTTDPREAPEQGITHLAFEVANRQEVDRHCAMLMADGFEIIDGPRVTGDGYYEFTTLDPDNNRVEVTTPALERFRDKDAKIHITNT
jgi:lactoylglutathione lyase